MVLCPSWLTDTSLPSPPLGLLSPLFLLLHPPEAILASLLGCFLPSRFTSLLISGIGFYAACTSRFYYCYQTPGINNLKRGHSFLIYIFKGFSSWFLDPWASASHHFDGSIFLWAGQQGGRSQDDAEDLPLDAHFLQIGFTSLEESRTSQCSIPSWGVSYNT